MNVCSNCHSCMNLNFVFFSLNGTLPQENRFKENGSKDLRFDDQFPNFPSTENLSALGETAKIRQGTKGSTTVRTIITRKPSQGKKEENVEENEKEKRRKAAGIKRRKQLFDSAIRRRKLLDANRRQLQSRKVKDPEQMISKPSDTTPTMVNLPSIVLDSSKQTSSIKSFEKVEEDNIVEYQNLVIDGALEAAMSRVMSEEMENSPVILAAINAIYQFVDMQEKVIQYYKLEFIIFFCYFCRCICIMRKFRRKFLPLFPI